MMNGTVGDSDSRLFSARHAVLTGMARDRKYVSESSQEGRNIGDRIKNLRLQIRKICVGRKNCYAGDSLFIHHSLTKCSVIVRNISLLFILSTCCRHDYLMKHVLHISFFFFENFKELCSPYGVLLKISMII